jgi:hypothetical protein
MQKSAAGVQPAVLEVGLEDLMRLEYTRRHRAMNNGIRLLVLDDDLQAAQGMYHSTATSHPPSTILLVTLLQR